MPLFFTTKISETSTSAASTLPGRSCGVARKIEMKELASLQTIQKEAQKKASETMQKEKEDADEKSKKKLQK